MATLDSKPLPALSAKDLCRFNARFVIADPAECWNWLGKPLSDGYGGLFVVERVDDQRLRRTIRAHRLAYFMATGIDPVGFVIMHLCDNRRCVNPSHLAMGTQRENLADMYRKGRGVTGDRTTARRFPGLIAGERHGSAKLTWAQVVQICNYGNRGDSRESIARKFQISIWTVYDIIGGRSWNPKYAPSGSASLTQPVEFTDEACAASLPLDSR